MRVESARGGLTGRKKIGRGGRGRLRDITVVRARVEAEAGLRSRRYAVARLESQKVTRAGAILWDPRRIQRNRFPNRFRNLRRIPRPNRSPHPPRHRNHRCLPRAPRSAHGDEHHGRLLKLLSSRAKKVRPLQTSAMRRTCGWCAVRADGKIIGDDEILVRPIDRECRPPHHRRSRRRDFAGGRWGCRPDRRKS